MNPILAFYDGGPDYKGRRLHDILAYGNRALEWHHDYIQVLFPLPEASPYNLRAPLLDANTIERFDADEYRPVGLVAAFRRMLRFYGFRQSRTTDEVVRKNFDRCRRNWLTPHNHNFRRISRILRCLTLLGLKPYAEKFLAALVKVYMQYSNTMGWERMYKCEDAISGVGANYR